MVTKSQNEVVVPNLQNVSHSYKGCRRYIKQGSKNKKRKKYKKINKKENPKKSKNIKTKNIKKEKVPFKTRIRSLYRRKSGLSLKVRLLLWLLGWKDDSKFLEGRTVNKEGKEDYKNTFAQNLTDTKANEVRFSVRMYTVQGALFLNSGRTKSQWLSNLERNKLVKSVHGNGSSRQNIQILHWNMGSKYWTRKKVEVEAVILKYNPDIMIISEANLIKGLTEDEMNIRGYTMIFPKTFEEQKVARLVLIHKEDMQVKVMPELMDKSVAVVWIGHRGRKPIVLAGYYREHQFILQDDRDDSGNPARQLDRLNKFVESWKKAEKGNDVIVLGDVNLDYVKWSQPEAAQTRMVDKIKNEVETLGFHQMVEKITRSWKGVPDSLIDHCWMNYPGN